MIVLSVQNDTPLLEFSLPIRELLTTAAAQARRAQALDIEGLSAVDRVNLHRKDHHPQWALDTVALVKQQAYAAHLQLRRPSMTLRNERNRQGLEIVCFLRVTLLELTDTTLLQANRRSQQLLREAAQRVQARRSGHSASRPARSGRLTLGFGRGPFIWYVLGEFLHARSRHANTGRRTTSTPLHIRSVSSPGHDCAL